jgi:hypothetical protein
MMMKRFVSHLQLLQLLSEEEEEEEEEELL